MTIPDTHLSFPRNIEYQIFLDSQPPPKEGVGCCLVIHKQSLRKGYTQKIFGCSIDYLLKNNI